MKPANSLRSLSSGIVVVLAVLSAASLSPSMAQPGEGAASPAAPAASGRVLEVVVETAASADGADAQAKAKENSLLQSEGAGKQPGCISSMVAAAAADPKGGPASVVRATVWAGTAEAEAASLAMDTGSPAGQKNAAYFRQLRDAKLGDGPIGHLEVVVFRTKPGVTREANLALFDKGEADYAQVGGGDGGLIAHSLWIAPDGRWVHLLYWRSEADYQKTGKALFGRPGVGGWIRSLDFKRFTVYRGDVVRNDRPSTPPAK